MPDTKKEQHAALKAKLVDALKKTGHVAAHALEAVADTAATVALAGKFGE